ncbi:MAG: DUF4340 domain-containing protein [Deltaproteobacteria bacterium]|nr:DUF4340 domain-containing protein [Deltaproteobacteria bacterium]
MMRTDLVVYSALLAAGLGAAYWASLPTPEGSEDAVTILTVEPKTVTEISFKSPDVDVTMRKRPSDERFAVTHTRSEIPPVNPHVPRDEKAPPPAPKVTTEQFLSNEKTQSLLTSFSPLYAVRVLDTVTEQQLQEYGLKDGAHTLVIKRQDGKDVSLRIGKRSYGSRHRFVQELPSGKRVLLIDDTQIENLERAPSRLYDRRIIELEPQDIAKAQLNLGDRSRRLDHSKHDQAGELIWTDEADTGGKQGGLVDNFMDKLFKLRIAEYASEADEQTLKDVKPFFTVVVEKDGKPVDRISFLKTGGDKPLYWVTSDFMKVHARLQASRVETIEKDLEAVLGDASKT